MNITLERPPNIGLRFKIAIVWLAILLLGSFWLTMKTGADPVTLAVIPQVPREGEPVIVIFQLNNPNSGDIVTRYQFYAGGKLLKEGVTAIPPGFSKTYKLAFKSAVPLGGQLNFIIRTKSERGSYQKLLSTPPYPPQIWSSFISFASFSTTVMSFMSTMSYYEGSFGTSLGFNLGLIFSIVLSLLLIFLELSQPLLAEKTILVLGNLRLRFNTLTWILLIIFMGIAYTKVVLIITG